MRSSGQVGFLALWAVGTLGCGVTPAAPQHAQAALEALPIQLLSVGKPVALSVGAARETLTFTVDGHFPAGLSMDARGTVSGTPTRAGEYQHVVVNAFDSLGNPVQSQPYTFAVSVDDTTLANTQDPATKGDEISFDGMTWGCPLTFAYAWDSQLGLLWPLRAGASLGGQALAPAGPVLALTVAGESAQGSFALTIPSMDARVLAIAQLTWDTDMDVDLILVPQSSLSLPVVVEGTQINDSAGNWAIRHTISSSTSPGPEVITFSDAPAGQYALVALKKSGTAATGHLWLAMRDRAGSIITDQDIPAALSDSAVADITTEITSGRQSYQALGLITVGPSSTVTYQPPDAAGDLFGGASTP